MTGVRSRIARRFWDVHSRGWDEIRADPELQAHGIEVIEWLAGALPAGGRVIDLGCGPGHHSALLAERGFQVTGVDYSPAMLERARTKARARALTVDFEQADLTGDLPGFPAPFDGALCVSVLQVIADPDAFLGRVGRLLRPGGHLLIEVPLPGSGISVPATPLRPMDRTILHVKHLVARLPGAVRRYPPDQLAAMLAGAGLVTVDTRTYPRTCAVLSQSPPAAPAG